jgi:hypothetical protein
MSYKESVQKRIGGGVVKCESKPWVPMGDLNVELTAVCQISWTGGVHRGSVVLTLPRGWRIGHVGSSPANIIRFRDWRAGMSSVTRPSHKHYRSQLTFAIVACYSHPG